MTRNLITYLLLLFLVVSCNDKETVTYYTVNGKANNIESDIVVFGRDSRFQKVDSIKADKKGYFSYKIECDTIIPFVIVMPDGKQVTMFAEPGQKAELEYDCIGQECTINGSTLQAMHDSISKVIEACTDRRKRMEHIEGFIKEHPVNEINIELIRRYAINIPDPDFTQIKNLISKLGGILQDNEFLAITKKNIDNSNGNVLHRQLPAFKYTTADSCKEITHDTFNKKHLLVTLWAPWDQKSREKMKHLRDIDKAVESKEFEILNIALEHDTTEWKRCIDSDSIIGHNVCDTKVWDSEIAGKFKIKSLPYSILVNPYQRIIRLDVDLAKDSTVIDSIIAKHEKSQKDREKREKAEKERKRRNKE